MATQAVSKPIVQSALLFMPDISGFTQFVNETEILHAQSIIQEVLEILLESNQLSFEVGGIEGDAIFFYRLGKAPTIDQLLEQVKTMYTRFHQHLQLYDQKRICPCNACKSAKNLKLKIIAHYGEVATYDVKEHQQLYGKDVIVVHRLLKNSLNKKEYALLTDSIFKETDSLSTHPLLSEALKAAENYDIGEIHFKVIDLMPLHQALPLVEAPVICLADKTRVAFSEEKVIDASIEKVFLTISDLSQRTRWMEGIKGIEILSKDSINRMGTIHRCVIGKNNPIIVTVKAMIKEDEMELVEMDQKGIAGLRYYLQKGDEKETLLRLEILIKRSFLISLFFDLLMKAKMKKQIIKSMENLQHYCNESDDKQNI
ncbi:MAG: DUF2652 domain-containing protein [Flavisolibacter sp.]|nr:DUF2652 domain-containing protein [Flavisolibacter sp.]